MLPSLSCLCGEFEAGISTNGQMHEHILLSYTLGVKHMIIGVNKMNEKTVNSSEKRHNDFKTEIGNFLKRTGFNPDKIPFILISDFNGNNTVEWSEKMPWYKGQTLHEALDTSRSLSVPLRSLCVFRCRTSTSRALGQSCRSC